MAYSLRKIQMAILALVITATGSLQGNDDILASRGCYEAPCIPAECCYDPGSYPCCCRFFVDACLLYFRAFEGGLSSPCDSTQITDSTVGDVLVSTLHGDSHDPNFDWNLGFRIGAGYEFANSNCDIGAYWTRYHAQTCNQNGQNAHNWKIDFDVLDVVFSCACDWRSCFAVIPFVGLRYASIDQRLRTNLVSTVDGTSFTSTGNSKEDFYGVGPLFGIEGDVGIGCGLNLYGFGSVGVLYGRFHVRSNETEEVSTGIEVNYLRKCSLYCEPVFDAGVGIGWETCFCNNMLVIFQLGFEHHQYFNQNQFCSYGDLSLDGISLCVGIEF